MSRVDNRTNTQRKLAAGPTKAAASGGSSATAAPEPTPPKGWKPEDNFVDAKGLAAFSKSVRADIARFARSDKAKVSDNRDGSQTRSRETTRGNTTRTQQLTSKDGPLGESGLKYVTSSKTGNREVKNTRTAQSDVFGRTQSSQTREVTVKKGKTETTSAKTRTEGALGLEQRTQTETKKVTRGSVATSESRAETTDRFDNRRSSQEKSRVVTDGKTTTTTTVKTSEGAELSTANVSKLEDGKYSVGATADWKRNRAVDASWNKEHELRAADQGLKASDKLAQGQKVGDFLGAAGAKVDLVDRKFDDVTSRAAYQDANSFVGSRVGVKGEEKLSVGADGVTGAFKREAVAGLYAENKGSTSGKYGEASYEAQAKVEAKATVDAKGKLDLNGLDLTVGAKAGVSAEASISGKATTKPVKVAGVDLTAGVEGTAKVSAEASAEATGKVKVTRNPPTAIAEGTVGASAVAKAEVEVKASAGPFAVKASAYASAGAEAKASGVIGYEDGKLKLGGSAGAALGLGAGGSATVEIDVKQIGDMAVNTAVAVGDVNNDGKLGLDDAKAAAGKVASGVKSTVNGAAEKVSAAAEKVKGWFSW